MGRKRYKPQEIVAKLRQVDVLVSQGQNMVDATSLIVERRSASTISSPGTPKICCRPVASWPTLKRWLEDERNFLVWRGELDAWREGYDNAGQAGTRQR